MSGSDAYDFDDTSTAEQLAELGVIYMRLTTAKGKPIGKDGLVKLLKQARALLETAAQTNTKECQASSEIASSLIKKPFIDHNDQDVKSLVASCLSHVLRLHVSECPYSPQQQKVIFTLFMWVIRKLEDPTATSFVLHQSTLNVIHQTKCCLLLLDLDDEDFLSDMFRVLLGSVNSTNSGEIGAVVLEIMSMLVEDGDDVSPQLLDAIICGLLLEDAAGSSIAQQLIQEQEAYLRPQLQRHLLAIVAQDADDDALDNGPALILKVQRACPRVLLPIVQSLAAQLRATSEEARCATLALVGGLLSATEVLMEEQHPGLFAAFLDRSNDVKATVRAAFMRQCSKVLVVCGTEHARQQLVDLLVNGLMDVDEMVRLEAVEAISDAAATRLSLLGEDQHALTQVAGRLRDAKAAVRQAAATRLLSLYRSSVSQNNGEDQLAWIPSCLLRQAVLEKSFGAMVMGSAALLRDGLLPSKTPDDEGARHWVALYQEADRPARSAIMRLLAARDCVQQDVVKLAGARSRRAAAADDAATERAQADLERYSRRVVGVAQLGDSAKAEEALIKVADLKDNHIFKSLVALCVPGATREECRKHSKEVLSRTSSRGALSTVTAALCRRVTQALLAPEHILHLLTLTSQATAHEPPAFAAALADLLTDTATAAPRLYAGQGPTLVQLVGSRDETASRVALRVLADAGFSIAAAAADRGGADFPSEACLKALLAMAAAQDATVAKTAVRAVAAVYGDKAASNHLASTISRLTDGLAAPRTGKAAEAVGSSIAAISMAVRLMPEKFGSQAETTAAFVISELMQAEVPMKQQPQLKRHHRLGLEISPAVDIKLAALKAVARMCTPWHQLSRRQQPSDSSCDGNFGGKAISEVVKMLLPQLPPLLLLPGMPLEEETPRQYLLNPEGVDDRAAVRWAAGTSLLRLARCHDGALSVGDFHAISLMLSDPEPQARAGFIKKLANTIRHFQVHRRASRAAKFASLLFLCGQDPEAPNQEAAMKLLHQFVVSSRRTAAVAAAAAAARRGEVGTLMQEHPEFMLPFALHLLAHHPDCPSPEEAEADDERLLPFVAMLQFGIEPLVLGDVVGRGGSAVGGREMVSTLLRTVRRAVDTSDSPLTDNIRMLAELGRQVADSITAVAAPEAASVSSRRGASDWSYVPGDVPLPHKLYGNAPDSSAKPPSLLPLDLVIQVESLFNSPKPASVAKTEAQPRRKANKRASPIADCGTESVATPTRPHRRAKQQMSARNTPSSMGTAKRRQLKKLGAGDSSDEDPLLPLVSPSSSNKENSRHRLHSSNTPLAASPQAEAIAVQRSLKAHQTKPSQKKGKAASKPKKSGVAKQARRSVSAAAAPQDIRRQPRRGAKAAAQGKLADSSMSDSE